MIIIIGYIFAAIVGIVLGLTGGGGSILTVPVLVYLFDVKPVLSTSYSLIIVGLTSIIGVFAYVRNKNINYKTGIIFAVPALTAVYLTRRYVLPSIPETIFSFDSFIISKDVMIMVVFASLMIFSANGMIRNRKVESGNSPDDPVKQITNVIVQGIVVGFLTGLVGAGGGFLIIPALVLFAKIPMKQAVGTSLLIISINSLIGFAGDLGTSVQIDWVFVSIFAGISMLGMLAGASLSKYISSQKLKPAFGWFVLVAGSFIIIQNIINIGGK